MTTVLGIAGGSGSGKTTVAQALATHGGPERVQVLVQDAYYRDRRDLSFDERCQINYDHPDAFDEKLLVEHVRGLREGKSIRRPVYDYAKHARTDDYVTIHPAKVVILEGILVLAMPQVRDLCDIRIFVDTDADVRFIRRLRRDTAERGRTIDSVIEQYLATVRPMHEAFCEPSKRFADLIVPEGGRNEVALKLLRAKIDSLVGK
ncbi:MAG TPA: uridine kinase [Planctomycetota bacterium]|nr:uridine kinase [Planctomycetota bacterium]